MNLEKISVSVLDLKSLFLDGWMTLGKEQRKGEGATKKLCS